MSPTRLAVVLLPAALALAACKKEPPPAAAPPAAVPPPAGVVPGAPSLIPRAPEPGAAAGAPASGLEGVVLERLDALNYTYLRIKGDRGETWAAVPTTQVAVGARVNITNPMPMPNFESKTLGRTFDLVMFGGAAEVLGDGRPLPADAPTGAAPVGAGAAAPAAAALAPDLRQIKVARATGKDARTVAEVWAERAQLNDKPATVRARVVKVTSGVLGKNWLHLRDGTGSDAAQDNDLVVTTGDTVGINDEVVASGVVHTDRDLGSGYSYKVLMENAKVVPAPAAKP